LETWRSWATIFWKKSSAKWGLAMAGKSRGEDAGGYFEET